jgi:hypothetical protein
MQSWNDARSPAAQYYTGYLPNCFDGEKKKSISIFVVFFFKKMSNV